MIAVWFTCYNVSFSISQEIFDEIIFNIFYNHLFCGTKIVKVVGRVLLCHKIHTILIEIFIVKSIYSFVLTSQTWTKIIYYMYIHIIKVLYTILYYFRCTVMYTRINNSGFWNRKHKIIYSMKLLFLPLKYFCCFIIYCQKQFNDIFLRVIDFFF